MSSTDEIPQTKYSTVNSTDEIHLRPHHANNLISAGPLPCLGLGRSVPIRPQLNFLTNLYDEDVISRHPCHARARVRHLCAGESPNPLPPSAKRLFGIVCTHRSIDKTTPLLCLWNACTGNRQSLLQQEGRRRRRENRLPGPRLLQWGIRQVLHTGR